MSVMSTEDMWRAVVDAVQHERWTELDCYIEFRGTAQHTVENVIANTYVKPGATLVGDRRIEWPDGSWYSPGRLHAAGTPESILKYFAQGDD